MKALLSFVLTALSVATTASAAEPVYRFQCASQELGLTEIVLSNPVQETIGCSYFEIDLKRQDLNGNTVETRHQPEKDSSASPNFNARFCRGESYVLIRMPPSNVDWSKHANECRVNSTLAGTTFSLDTTTGKVVPTYEGQKTYYDLQETNPAVEYRWESRGGPYRVLVPYLNGRECPRSSTYKEANPDPVCKRLN